MGPLRGYRVIEFAGLGPGPFCGMMLADMGAEVLRIERTQAPADVANIKLSSTHNVLHRGRRSIALDLKQPEAFATVREAANLLRGRSIGCLPVFDGDQLAGIVTTSDLLELIGRGVERPVAESTRWTLGRRPSRAAKRR